MSEVISKWILHRLGIIIDTTPNNFAVKTSNGLLLAQLLHSYEIITPEELSLIKYSDSVPDCYDNFRLLTTWLRYINLTMNMDDLYEIVHGIGSTSLHLFYQVFLELKDKTKLDFLTDDELNVQLGRRINRFNVTAIDDSTDPNKFDLHKEGLCEPFLAGGDVYHWYKDRMETIQNRCKEARDEYIHNVKNRCRPCSGADRSTAVQDKESAFVFARGLAVSPKPSNMQIPELSEDVDDLDSLDERTYDDLLREQDEARNMPPLTPDPKEARSIIKKLKTKSKVREENKILRNQLHQEIMNAFDKKINDSKAKIAEEVLTNTFMKQSLYEKELVSKVGQVMMFKETMIDNKIKQAEILNKLKEKDFMDGLILKDKELNEKKLSYYMERDRALKLHNKLWTERIKVRERRHRDICLGAFKDMTDIAIRISEFKKKFGREPNQREMEELKHLFVTSQPIFPICEPVINIIKDGVADEIPEIIITKETSRQDAIDEQEFSCYLNYEWPWELNAVNIGADVFRQITNGMNVLGFLIHRALSTKYPVVTSREVPSFPDATVRVCINGLNDSSVVAALRSLLAEKEIKVIELNQAVNYCIDSYKEESKREYPDEAEKPTKEGKAKKDKPEKKKKGEKSKKRKKENADDDAENRETEKQLENKNVQTPIKFPCEEIPYSDAALLGKTAQELLDDGQPLGDFLLIDMFISYLTALPNLKGWVLVNYPTNFDQATILEEALTGKNLMSSAIKLAAEGISDIIYHEAAGPLCEDKDECSLYLTEDKCISKLLPNPVVPEPPKIYDTVLTAYIKIRKLAYEDKSGDGILPPGYEELGEEPDPLDRFYSSAGANYSMYYKEFDPGTIKYLGKLIIGDYSLPLKSSLELFGTVTDLDQPTSRGAKSAKRGEPLKKPKQKMVHDLGSETTGKKSTKTDKKGKKVIIVYENKAVQVPSDEEEEEIEEIDLSTEVVPGIPETGEPGWEYCKVDCAEELLISIATLWEVVEEIYINDFKQVLFLKRLTMDSIMPFVQYVKEGMKKIVNRPDYKGFYLSKFQKAFNRFEMDFRKDDEFKAEMHCRIEDFKEKLLEMSDIKMMESENIRCRIIDNDWTPTQLTELINCFINMIQIELDRFIESVRCMNDYYLGIITGIPSDQDTYKDDAISKCLKINYAGINTTFQDVSSSVDLSYFDDLFNTIMQKVRNCVKRLNNASNSMMDRTKGGPAQKSKSKLSSPKSKATASKNGKKSVIEPETLNAIKENYDKLVEEWECALKGETLRVNLRFDLLKFNALQCIEEFVITVRQAFHEVFNEIYDRYKEENRNVEIACNMFQSAVENEEPMQKELLFDEYMFKINPQLNMFENPLIVPDLPREVVDEGAFTISQLSHLAAILLDLSPSGYIPRATFEFILQDLIFVNPGRGINRLTPKLWENLSRQSFKTVINSLFDDLEYVYWKDFIIYNMRLNFPTEKELLLTRRALRGCDPDATELVQNYQFFATRLWFECEFKKEEFNKLQDIKKLLYKLYSIKNYGMNYTAFLLDFCKDVNPVVGFAKALELSIGKLVCWDPEMGNLFKEDYYRRNMQHEEAVKKRDDERAIYYEAVYNELSKLIDQITYEAEGGLVIEELEESKNGSEARKVQQEPDLDEVPVKDSQELSTDDVKRDESNVRSDDTSEKESPKKEESQLLKLYNKLPDNVGTESDEFTDTIFFLTLDPLITVITAALPWHARVDRIGDLTYCERAAQIFEESRNADFNMAVLSHEYLSSERFQKLLALTKKFRTIDPVRVVSENAKELSTV